MDKINTNIVGRDLKHIWHPCSQMKDYENFPPIEIIRAEGAYLYPKTGKPIIDAISSWWCKSLGHQHPALKKALVDQLDRFEHIIHANTTHDSLVFLSEKLSRLSPHLNKVFFASEGSCAIEIAIKMSVHTRKISGEKNRSRFISLKNSYHGETLGALAISDLGLYREAYEDILMPVTYIDNIPYVTSREDPLWKNCESVWPDIEKQLEKLNPETITALVFEPILQGAGGMLIYSQDFLKRLRVWTAKHNIHLIADEILTGFGRTGFALSCDHAEIQPDFICLGKGLTAGFLPMSAVLTSTKIYDLFYDDAVSRAFLHSHTFGGNALAASVALACLEILETEKIYQKVQQQEKLFGTLMREVAEKTGKIQNIRHIGAMAAADLIVSDPKQRLGFEVFKKAVKLGAWLRPLGNTIYWLPPLNISEETLHELKEVTTEAILAV